MPSTDLQTELTEVRARLATLKRQAKAEAMQAPNSASSAEREPTKRTTTGALCEDSAGR
jgi:hypothetical protein